MSTPIWNWIRKTLTPYQIEWDGDNQTGYLADLERKPIKDMDAADVVSSQMRTFVDGRSHQVILDIDHPAWLVPSSTPGHHHLYIEVPGGIEHEGYMALVALLGHLRVIEPGYAMASIRRGHTDLRPPWVRKGSEPGRTRAREGSVEP